MRQEGRCRGGLEGQQGKPCLAPILGALLTNPPLHPWLTAIHILMVIINLGLQLSEHVQNLRQHSNPSQYVKIANNITKSLQHLVTTTQRYENITFNMHKFEKYLITIYYLKPLCIVRTKHLVT